MKHHGFSKEIENENDKYADLESNLINIFSNHIHGRYPEMMDIYGEFSFCPKLRGNLESQDIDANLEIEFLDELAKGFVKGFKVALLGLNMAQAIGLSSAERDYCFAGVFAN
jgi:hypothetical protein